MRHWAFAITIGVTVTVQGALAAVRRLVNPATPLEEVFSDFSLERDYSLLFLFAIPLVWFVIWLSDRLQYRLRN